MRAVVQRVRSAAVRVNGETAGEIGPGLLALVAVGVDDDERDARWMSDKIAGLRIFPDEDGLMNRCLADTGAAVLLVSQFTLYGDARKGRRPSFINAAKEPLARDLYELVGATLEAGGIPVAYGVFGASMDVELINAGPVTILLDSKHSF